jgi:Xaa-Pro aminopeptidase
MAIVLTREAAVFVDGRYTLQARKAGRCKAWQVEPLVDPPPEHWLARTSQAGDRLGFDPWLHTSGSRAAGAACAKAGAELIAVDTTRSTRLDRAPAPPLGR